MNTFFLILCAYVGFSTQVSDQLKITVYYEALCPDSVRFITKQLYPTYSKIGKFLNIDFVPYGKASQRKENNTWTFECQHGPKECQADKQQACALQLSSDDQCQSVGFIYCVLNDYEPDDEEVVQKCATKYGLSGTSVLKCSNSSEGDEYLAKYGDRTHAANPPISFVPTIVFNDVYDKKIQFFSLRNLLKTACKALSFKPKKCSKFHPNYYSMFWN